jgi:predicted ATPase
MANWLHRKPPDTSIAMGSDATSPAPAVEVGAKTRDEAVHLPVALTVLIGRDSDIEAIAALLESDRLVTLVGPGGIGKTRLAVAVATAIRRRFSDGAWMVDLSGLADPTLVAKTIASALEVRDEPGRTPLESLKQHLASSSELIVVDNCEHLIDAVAEVVDDLMRHCPGVRVLGTSREALRLEGEVTWPVPALSLPPEASSQETAATELFVARAQETRSGFKPTNAEQLAIAAICRRLDGLPLAIELAAARMPHLTVAEIASRLDDRFRLLTGGSRAALPRQRTLEAAVRWSYDLLDQQKQDLFNRLSVFAGGFTLEAVDACFEDAGRSHLDDVAELVDKSLVTSDEVGDVTRYRMLETIRAFARERLMDGGNATNVRSEHLRWLANVMADSAQHIDGPMQMQTLAALDRELDNIRAALGWASDSGDPRDLRLGISAVCDLNRYWWLRSVGEGRYFLEQLIEGQPPNELSARVLFVRGVLAAASGDFAAGVASLRLGLAGYKVAGDRQGTALAQYWLARYIWAPESMTEVLELLEHSCAYFREVGDIPQLALTLLHLAVWHLCMEDIEQAQKYVDEVTSIASRVNVPNLAAHSAEIAALAECESARPEAAVPLCAQAIEHYDAIQNRNCLAHCIDTIAYLTLRRGNAVEAAAFLGAASAVRQQTGVPVLPYEDFMHVRFMNACRGRLTPQQFDAGWRDGQSLDYASMLDRARKQLAST